MRRKSTLGSGGVLHPAKQTAERLIVVSAGDNPTLDYYVTPRLAAAMETRPSRIVTLRDDPDVLLASPEAEGAHLLFCRYVNQPWLDALADHRERLAGVSVLLDDDIAAVARDPSAPLLYRRRLRHRFLDHWPRFSRLIDGALVSTPALAERIHHLPCKLVPPLASPCDEPIAHAPRSRVRIAFHATGIHAAEHAWIGRVIRRVLRRKADIEMSVVVGWGARLHWRRVPAQFIRPAAWTVYREASRQLGADLMLAPLLETPANRVRAPTKRIDAMRMGAALLTNAADVYRPDPAEIAAGMLVPLDAGKWTTRILDLVSDEAALRHLAALNAAHVRSWHREAGPLPL